MDRITGDTTVDIGGGRRGFRDRNAGAGLVGTFVKAEWVNAVQEEIMKVITAAGLVPDAENWTQLEEAIRLISATRFADAAEVLAGIEGAKAVAPDTLAPTVQSGRWNYAVADGTANALAISLTPALAAIPDGLPLRIKVTARNTGAVTLAVGVLPAAPLLRPDGIALAASDLLPGDIISVAWDGAAFRVVGVLPSMVPIVLTAAQTFWIRPDGNDSNDGSANDAGHAFQTLRGAWDAIATRYAPSDKYPITLRLGIPGDYEGVLISGYGGKVIIQGDEANKLVYNIVERAGTTYCLCVNGSNVEARGVTFDSRVASGELLMLWALRGGRVGIRNVGFRRKVHNAALIMIYIASGGSVFTQGQIDLAGPDGFNVNIKAVVQTDIGGTYEGGVYADPTTYRPYNLNPGTGFAWATALSLQSWLATTMSPIGVGSSGKRFTVDVNSAINTGGAGVNYFPGGSAGTAATGGLYL